MIAPMKARERGGHDSIAKLDPAGHSAPMPIPRTARTTRRNVKFGEKPAMKLQTENHRMESIRGPFRPMRSASQPDAIVPAKRNQIVSVSIAATAVTETSNSSATATMMNRKIV